MNPQNFGSKAQGLSLEVSGLHVNLPSKPRKEPWSSRVLECTPYNPASLGGQALELQVRVWEFVVPNLRYMGHTIWNREFITDFGRQPGLEITPEGYILIRTLAAVFQSHCRNFTFYFIFSKPACPSFFSQSSHFLGVLGCHSGDMARVLRELGHFGEVSTPCWIKRGMDLRKKKKNPKSS